MRVIFFDIDSLRPDHLGCYGYERPTSPVIDRVASRGVCFDRYYCATSPCMPSRAAWVSGQFGIHNGVMSNIGVGSQFRLRHSFARRDGQYDGDILHVPELLQRHLRVHGFDSITISNFADRHDANWFLYGWTEAISVNLKGGREQGEEVAARARRWLSQNRERDDYFLHINFWDVHRCYNLEPVWAERFADSPVPQAWPDEAAIQGHRELQGHFTAHGQFANDSSPFALMPGAIRSRADFEKLVTGYDSAIAYVDHQIGTILDVLREQGLLEETAVIISADHGDAFGEHGIYSDHVTVDECVQRVPLILSWPGCTDGGRCEEMLLNTDFYPSLCALLGIPLPERVDGESFAACLSGGRGPGRDHLVWDSGNYTLQRAVRTPAHLYIETYDHKGYGIEPVELYDLVADPWQARNLAASEPEMVQACRAHLESWRQEQLAKPNAGNDPLEAILAERQGTSRNAVSADSSASSAS